MANNNEYLLHYVWKYRLFSQVDLQTVDGQKIEIIDPGMRNTDAGADFFNAKVKIEDKVWAGNVEIHHSSDDWNKHGHHTDENYNSVILHVVETVKGCVKNQKGMQIPQMQLTVGRYKGKCRIFAQQQVESPLQKSTASGRKGSNKFLVNRDGC